MVFKSTVVNGQQCIRAEYSCNVWRTGIKSVRTEFWTVSWLSFSWCYFSNASGNVIMKSQLLVSKSSLIISNKPLWKRLRTIVEKTNFAMWIGRTPIPTYGSWSSGLCTLDWRIIHFYMINPGVTEQKIFGIIIVVKCFNDIAILL